MDLLHQNSSSPGLGICSSLGVLSPDNRMPSSYNSSGTSSGPLSPNLSSMKQCRSSSDVEVDARDDGGPLKLARKDSFSYSRPSAAEQHQQHQHSQQQQQQQQHVGKLNMNSGGGGGAPAAAAANNNNNGPAGSHSFSGDNGGSRIACSPTNSCLSDGVLVASDAAAAANLMGGDTRMLRSDAMASPGSSYNLAAANSNMRPFSYQSYQYPGASGSPLMLAAAAAARGDHLGMQSAMSMRGPFTANQWAELEHQALIFKYMMAGASVPPELLNPIRRSVALNNLASSHPSLRMGWGNFHLGIPNNPDPEPGRCRRTDGKKWRCSREVVPDQKYCDRHMHRGRNRSKKNAENQAAAAAAAAAANSQSAAAAAAGGNTTTQSATNVGGVVQSSGLNQIHSSLRPPLGMNGQNHHQHPSVGAAAAAAAAASPFNSGTPTKSNFSSLPTGIPSGNNSGSSLQFPMQSLSGASPGGNKDYRYMSGMSKPELGLGPEQLLFSDSPLSSVHHQWQQNFQSKFPRLSSSSSNNSPSSPLYPQHHQHQHQHQHQQQELRSLSGQQHFEMPEASQINHLSQPLLGPGYGGGPTAAAAAAAGLEHVGRDCEEQPLRHFFDDWPRQRDPSTISWNDIEDDQKQHQHQNQQRAATPPTAVTAPGAGGTTTIPRTTSATQLSISLPMSSSDFRVATSPRGKLSLSPLKLSMSRSEFEEDQLGGDPTRMGLGVGLGGGSRQQQQQQQQTWMQSLEGGPLAEVLQSSTPRDHCKSSPGLNLLGDGWESSSRETSRMPSPTAVLTKTPFGSFSDSSSNASSPRAVHAEALLGNAGSKQLTS
ncbi:hypothetical protein SELMODRAFT_442763 [Selaginella moellendorffii]|uniref:Growth-regulating factor n=1 Tax=Selaginella moellendorffii TaxID=88036 RepID=D8RVV9_SELML|nr:growth-regulating factor 6 [Selaginella moellendorffii]EFJ24024.1 hypothetical protein SELMODRAFT_442763 [Selaginella moellendorffii]|eukprot:XP_002975239.1 growth-regulating factor 6 [Selaginella moellendorffii]